MRLFHPPLRLSIFYGSRDQPRPGSFLKKREEPGNEVALGIGFIRFKHGRIRWHTVGHKFFFRMLKNFVRIRTYWFLLYSRE